MPVISSILFNTCFSAGKDLWAKPSAGKNQCSSNEIAVDQLHISPAKKLVPSSCSSGEVILGCRSATHYVLGPGQMWIRLSPALRVWKKRFIQAFVRNASVLVAIIRQKTPLLSGAGWMLCGRLYKWRELGWGQRHGWRVGCFPGGSFESLRGEGYLSYLRLQFLLNHN